MATHQDKRNTNHVRAHRTGSAAFMRALVGHATLGLAGVALLGGTAVAAPPTIGKPTIVEPVATRVIVLGGTLPTAAELTTQLQRRFGPDARPGFDGAGRVVALRRLALDGAGLSPEALARRTFAAHRDLLGLGAPGAAALELVLDRDVALPENGGRVLSFRLAFDGHTLERRSATARFTGDGRLAELRVDPLPAQIAVAERTIDADAATAAVTRTFGPLQTGRPTLVLWQVSPTEARLAWRVPTALVPLVVHHMVWVDATDGRILRQEPAGFDHGGAPLQARHD
jgi:hypothetical protein